MSVSFVGAEGSTVTILITETTGQRLRLSGPFTNRYYTSNFDSDGDRIDDSIKASFTYDPAPSGAIYGIFLVHGRTSDLLAVVDDYSGYPRQLSYSSHPSDAPSAFLGSEHRDRIDADLLDWANGNGGVDVITGGPKDQTLLGGAGNDRIDGRAGDDVLDGGLGRDQLTGGAGADVFAFAPGTFDRRDVIDDFSQGEHDRIDLSAFAGLHLVDAFDGAGPEVRVGDRGNRTELIFDLDGDGAADARIAFAGTSPSPPPT